MSVPASMTIVSDKDWLGAPHVPFKSNKLFDNHKNVLEIVRNGGLLRGMWSPAGAGMFEIMCRRDLRDEGEHVRIGHGRRVPSEVVERLISLKGIWVSSGVGAETGIVVASPTRDTVYNDGFPVGYAVIDRPYEAVTSLVHLDGKEAVVLCERPRVVELYVWLDLARKMAIGIADA